MTNYDSYYKLRQVFYKLWQPLQITKIIANYDRTCFQNFNLEINFLVNEKLFQKAGIRLKKHYFHTIGTAKWTLILKKGIFPVTFIFWKILFQFKNQLCFSFRFDEPTTQMSKFTFLGSAGVLFEGIVSLWVSLKTLKIQNFLEICILKPLQGFPVGSGQWEENAPKNSYEERGD